MKEDQALDKQIFESESQGRVISDESKTTIQQIQALSERSDQQKKIYHDALEKYELIEKEN